jgi:hypothetical protein
MYTKIKIQILYTVWMIIAYSKKVINEAYYVAMDPGMDPELNPFPDIRTLIHTAL